VGELTDLIYLSLDNTQINQINDINPLNSLPYLCLYYFDSNPINDISVLAELKNLSGLYLFDPLFSLLSSEQIEEIKEAFKEALPNINIRTPQYDE
jgi:Leucine-rich repeat (LRR) protein